MSKKNRHNRNSWGKVAQAPVMPSEPVASASEALDLSPISPAQLAANRANAKLSTGPRTPAGLNKSSQNAVKSALTGRTVLLPTDDVEEYAAFLAEFQADLRPVGQRESELVQIIVDCHWRLRRIQELEYALYTHGQRQFEAAFADEPEPDRRSMIILQTHLTYQKDLRNLHIQEARIDRKRAKAIAEFDLLQSERNVSESAADEPADAPFASEAEFFRALDAGYIPPNLAARLAQTKQLDENGFDFSNAEEPASDELIGIAEPTVEHAKAA
ncbi:MAG: hypothetical protein JO051_11270 [Acidobacteriaceae bacterium]|nr:hypothetical protein [Acidobacteriaceae bacterium]